MTHIATIDEATGTAYVTMAEYERLHKKARIYRECLLEIARRMNHMADDIEAMQTQPWGDDTEPAPLDE